MERGNRPVIFRIVLAPRGRARARAPPPAQADEGPVQPPRSALSGFLEIDSMQMKIYFQAPVCGLFSKCKLLQICLSFSN